VGESLVLNFASKFIMEFWTSREIGASKDRLVAVRAGAAWVYVDSIETFTNKTVSLANGLLRLIDHSPVIQFSYVNSLSKKSEPYKHFSRELIRYLVNLACSMGLSERLLCQTESGSIYTAYIPKKHTVTAAGFIEKYQVELERNTSVSFSDAYRGYFGDQRGAYFWSKALLEHLVYLGIARHLDKWRVRM